MLQRRVRVKIEPEFVRALGCPVDPELLVCALTHRSYAHENSMPASQNYERLEFLGDAVLGMVVANDLYLRFADVHEGVLTKMRAHYVCRGNLARVAREIGVNKVLLLSEGEIKTHGSEKDSILCDAFEAIVGAVYLTNGLDTAADFVRRTVLKNPDETKAMFKKKAIGDFKSHIVQLAMRNNYGEPQYIYEESGPDHAKVYTATLTLPNLPDFVAVGVQSTKRKAATSAAKKAAQELVKNKKIKSDLTNEN